MEIGKSVKNWKIDGTGTCYNSVFSLFAIGVEKQFAERTKTTKLSAEQHNKLHSIKHHYLARHWLIMQPLSSGRNNLVFGLVKE
jgi:hypothetical protein